MNKSKQRDCWIIMITTQESNGSHSVVYTDYGDALQGLADIITLDQDRGNLDGMTLQDKWKGYARFSNTYGDFTQYEVFKRFLQ